MIKKSLLKKGIAFAVMLLFIITSITPSTGNLLFNDDTTPPVTTYTLDPPVPDGDNGWYVSDVEICLDATDDLSGVKAIYYRVDGGEWKNHTGEPHVCFLVEKDGWHIIEYYSVDNAGNKEDVKSTELKMDQTRPELEDFYLGFLVNDSKLYAVLRVIYEDAISGKDRVDFYINYNDLEFTDYEEPYEWTIEWSKDLNDNFIHAVAYDRAGNYVPADILRYLGDWSVVGFIVNPEVNEEDVTFFAIAVLSTYNDWWPYPSTSIHLFKHLTFPNNYRGYIGRFFISAIFYNI